MLPPAQKRLPTPDYVDMLFVLLLYKSYQVANRILLYS